MAAVTTAVLAGTALVGTAANMVAANKQRKAQKSAIKGQEQAAIESAQLLQEQGLRGEEAIRQAGIAAAQTAEGIPGQAIDPLQRFADAGRAAFQDYSGSVLSGGLGGLSGIAQFAGGPGQNYAGSDPIQAELARKAGVSGDAAARGFMAPLQSMAGMGAGVAGDIAGIQGRGADRLADIAAQTAAGRSGALVGSAPAAQQALLGAGESRILSDYANQNFNAQALNSLSRLVGELRG